ncbi:carbonic anhydrase 1-like [Engystomops pustulosus]|uniref:carbonic anhydrase 1-like n=1 Tax=Engystomops pustulosus TaxID=76066 RepID=UPI003AFABB15
MLRLVCVGVLYLILGCQAAGDWCYEHAECAPETWAVHYPLCGLNSQSPINILTSQVKESRTLGPINIYGSSRSTTGVVTNNGHTVEVVLDTVYQLSGAGLPDVYQMAGLHFHFGNLQLGNEGSEHLIDGNAFPLEAHFVFYNTKYADLATAKANEDGLAVVGVLFKIGESNADLDNLISVLPNVDHKGDTATTSINLEKMLPNTVSNYYKYQGSLTTPPCSENVAWHLISSPLDISISQYEAIVSSLYFTTSDSVEQSPMVNNYRPPQPLNGRTVFKYSDGLSTNM